MAFFKFRKGGEDATAKPASTETVEAIRKRAKHRLLGAALLVLLGVVGFPLLFDSQPRPVAVDIPIEIPDRAKVKPLAANPEAKAQVAAPVSDATVITETREQAGLDKPTQTASPPAHAEEASVPAPVSKVDAKTVAKAEIKAPPKVDSKPEVKADEKVSPDAGRFVVQVGAYADPAKAREARLKVEHAGMKTYTQEVQTPDGSRTRVRVGPFAGRAEADKVAAKIKKLNLAAAVLSL